MSDQPDLFGMDIGGEPPAGTETETAAESPAAPPAADPMAEALARLAEAQAQTAGVLSQVQTGLGSLAAAVQRGEQAAAPPKESSRLYDLLDKPVDEIEGQISSNIMQQVNELTSLREEVASELTDRLAAVPQEFRQPYIQAVRRMPYQALQQLTANNGALLDEMVAMATGKAAMAGKLGSPGIVPDAGAPRGAGNAGQGKMSAEEREAAAFFKQYAGVDW